MLRVVLVIAEPIPVMAGGSASMTAWVVGAMARPSPPDMTTMPNTKCG